MGPNKTQKMVVLMEPVKTGSRNMYLKFARPIKALLRLIPSQLKRLLIKVEIIGDTKNNTKKATVGSKYNKYDHSDSCLL